jgi:hypothetical protein
MHKKIWAILLWLFVASTALGQSIQQFHPLDNMPLVQPRQNTLYIGAAPEEQRGPEFRNFLSASVKISVRGSSGSGTIVYHDDSTNTAYVATCGHLWSGTMSAQEGKQKNLTCKVIIWYQNETKLNETKEYPANVIFYSNRSGFDTALITFKPDWKPNYFVIAPLNYPIPPGKHFHSCGCDGGREVAHYDVEIVRMETSLVTKLNSPRPGRSGGGLMTDDGYYIATCWGTSSFSGAGEGYFTPLSSIHSVWTQNGYDFLLNMPPGGNLARQIQIVDRNNPQAKYAKDYIPIPSN